MMNILTLFSFQRHLSCTAPLKERHRSLARHNDLGERRGLPRPSQLNG